MPAYRVYILDGQSNIPLSQDIEASDDHAAIDIGWRSVALHSEKSSLPAQGVEIWRGNRLVFSSHPKT
jgi:hypothetical protein